jgi:hypothetical protein
VGVVEYVIGFLVFLALYAVFVWRKARQHRTEIRKLIRTHLKTLVLKRARGFSRDDYGKLVDSGWSKEIAYFYDNILPETLHRDHSLTDVAGLIEREIGKVPQATLDEWTMANRADVASGDDFEVLIGEQLEDGGWHVRRTGKSGDQGADLVAEKNGVSLPCSASCTPSRSATRRSRRRWRRSDTMPPTTPPSSPTPPSPDRQPSSPAPPACFSCTPPTSTGSTT